MDLRRTLLGPSGAVALVSTEAERLGFLVAFTERMGGESQTRFSSLNLGSRVGDDPERVRSNRELVRRGLEIPEPAFAEQVHGAFVTQVGGSLAGAGYDPLEAPVPGADALLTADAGVPVAVLAADCLPIALVAPESGRAAAVHAGWRGLAAGIIAEAARALDTSSREVHAFVGPAVGPCHFVVGAEVAAAVAGASASGAVTSVEGGSLRLDLAATAVVHLKEEGVESVAVLAACTACEEGRFFSYRRDGSTGRHALIVMPM